MDHNGNNNKNNGDNNGGDGNNNGRNEFNIAGLGGDYKAQMALFIGQLNVFKAMNTPPHKQFAMLSVMALPLVEAFLQDDGEENLKNMTTMIPMLFSALDEDMLEKASTIAQSKSLEEMKELVEKLTNGDTDYNHALKMVKGQRQTVEALSEDVQIEFTKAIYNSLTPKITDFIMMLGGDSIIEAGKIEQHVKDTIRDFKTKTDKMLAQEKLLRYKAIPTNMIANAIHEIGQKATPQALETLAEHIRDNLDEDDYLQLAVSALHFAEEFGKASLHKKYMQVEDKPKAAKFGKALRNVIEVITEGFEKAGLTANIDIIGTYKARVEILKNSNQGPGNPGQNNGPSSPKP